MMQDDKGVFAALGKLAALGVAAAGLIGCSADQHTYKSTYAAPKSLAVVYTQSGETAWSMDIPIDHKLEIDFKRDGEWQGFKAPATPATSFSWSLDPVGPGGQSDSGTVELSGQPVHLRPSLRPVGQDVQANAVPAPSPIPAPPPAMMDQPAEPTPPPAISEEQPEAPAPAPAPEAPQTPAPEAPDASMQGASDTLQDAARDLEEAATAAEPVVIPEPAPAPQPTPTPENDPAIQEVK